jgi:hypothetical protein
MISRIDGTGPLMTPQTIRRSTKSEGSSGTSFSRHLDEADDTSAAADTSALGNVAGVFNVQEVDDALARASKGKLRAQDILDKLDDLRLALLDGTMSKEDLMALARLVNSRKAGVSDPKLAEILDEIDLRAQVELAKFTSLPA